MSLLVKARGTPPDQIRRELHALALTDPRIRIVDRLLSREVMSVLTADCNVFLSQYRSAGFGLGYAEALAQGKIVVATDFGGTRDIISTETGYPVSLVPTPLMSCDYPSAEGS